MTTASSRAAGVEQRGATVLDRLSPAVRSRLARIATPMAFPAGAVVLREGADTPFLGFLERGRIALRLRVPERGEALTIVTIEPGEMLGWSAVVEPFRASVDAVATEPTELLAVDAAALREALAAEPELAAGLLPLVLESLSSRLTASWSQLLDLFATGGAEPW